MNEIVENLIDTSTLNDAASMASPIMDEVGDGFESKALTDYITTGIDEPHNNDVVKIIAAAMQIASEAGMLNTLAASPLHTAITAGNITQNLNLSYLIEEGEILADQAADMLIDRATANAYIIAESVLNPKVLKMGMDKALDAVGAFWPQLMPVTQFAKQFTGPIASVVTSKIKSVVRRGIQTVSNCAKDLAHGAIHKVANSIKTTAKGWKEKVKAKVSSIF